MKIALLSLIFGVAFGFTPSSQKSFLQRTGFSQSVDSSSALCAKYKKVFVAGGSKGVGRHVIDKLIAGGSEVVALVRSGDAVADLSAIDGVTVVQGDAFDYKCVEGAID